MRTTRPSGAFHSKRNTLELVSQFLTAGGYTRTTLILHFETRTGKSNVVHIIGGVVEDDFNCNNVKLARNITIWIETSQVNG